MPEKSIEALADLNDEQLLRYSRQIMLPQIDIAGQQALLSSRVLIIGVGGLGSPVALYLAACGVGHLTLADPDKVEISNLQRQIAHTSEDLGAAKVSSCQESMLQLNRDIKITPIAAALSGTALSDEVAKADIVVDCTDNLTARFEINKACVAHTIPLVSAASIRWEGQITVFHPGLEHSPCYHCFHEEGKLIDQSCSNTGVLGPVVGVIGSMQAIEVVKFIIQAGELLIGRVLLFDALTMQWESMVLPPNPQCRVCGQLN